MRRSWGSFCNSCDVLPFGQKRSFHAVRAYFWSAGQAPACWLPDMLVVAAEGLVDVEQEGQSVGAPADGALVQHTEDVERATTAIACDVNKPVKSYLHCEKVKI